MGRRNWTLPPPPDGGIDHLDPPVEALPPGQSFYRVQPAGMAEAFHFHHEPDNRLSSAFDPPRHTECYAALDAAVSLHERIFWNPQERNFFLGDLQGLELTRFESTAALRIMRFDHRACAALGIDISLLTSREIELARAWASALHAWREGAIDALVYPARTGGGPAVALFDRCRDRLRSCPPATPVLDWNGDDGRDVLDIILRIPGAVLHPF